MRELELLDRIHAIVGSRPGVALGIGDDAAVLTGDPATVATHDLLVEEVHFNRSTTGLKDLGHKALAVNLSDIAAMGAEPVAALVGLGLPDDGVSERVDDLYGGMEALAGRTGVTVAGGDISASATFFIAITVIGRLPAGRGAILRAGARPGDALCVTGTLGGSTAGLAVLDDPAAAEGIAAAAADEAVRRHRRPEPRLAEGRLLGGAGATAMLDVSDGLGVDALRLARASGVQIDVDVGRIPVDPSATAVGQALARDPLRLAWAGGEDYELLVTLPPPTVDDVAATLPAGLTTIGRVTEGPPSVRTHSAGAAVELGDAGYMHHV